MNATAHALAHGQANAIRDGSVHAKRSEVKGPDLTSPDLTALGVLGAVGDGGQIQSVTQVERGRESFGIGN